MFYILIRNFTRRVGLILILAFLLSKLKIFKKIISRQNIKKRDKFILAIIFGLFGIIGTYTGIEIQGALINSRVIGVVVGGLLGGPFVGTLSGLIAGGHRFLIDIGGFTSLACGISTLAEGIIAGMLREKFEKSKYRVTFSLMVGFLLEVLQMIIILIVAKPFSEALDLVSVIAMPMVLANGIGIGVFIAITDSIFKDIETESVYQAQLALNIAGKTLVHFRKGFNQETTKKIAEIICDMTNIKGVAFTDKEKILAHVGIGEDHHLVNSEVRTNITKRTLKNEKYIVVNTKEEIGCDYPNCSLKSGVIVPLKEGNEIIGLLKLYKNEENSVTKVEIELALGLAQIFSTQIELSKIDYQKELLAKAELNALQAQINPHFLFNAINTIVSLTRTQPDEARKLLIHLSTFIRKNLQQNIEEVNLEKEIEHINSYIEIEKARFGDKLDIIYDIPENINCKLPPLLLQPLVENAIKHGVVNRIQGGKVKISASESEKEIKLEVEDDGVGIAEEKLDYLLDNDENRDCIGLKNVNERLKNKYGDNYGLKIRSEINKGTNVTIIIPKN